MDFEDPSRSSDPPNIPAEEVIGSEQNRGQIHDPAIPAALYHLADQLHSPIYTIPLEILSLIFQEMVEPEDPLKRDFRARSRGLQQAFVLASVSTHFRDVALRTPELWERIHLPILAEEPSKWAECTSLLRHCASYASHLELSVRALGSHYHPYLTVKMIAQIFSSPVVKQKIKVLRLLTLFRDPREMISFLSSLPALDTLALFNDIEYPTFHIDLSSLSLPHAAIHDTSYLKSISLPSSTKVLHLTNIHTTLKLDFLKQCPDLVELVIDIFGQHNKSYDLFTLKQLKRLSATTTQILKNLQTRILNSLSLGWINRDNAEGLTSIIPFCRQISTSLTTLILNYFPETWESTDFQLLFGSLPKLRNLGLFPVWIENIVKPICALQYRKDTREDLYLPTLERLVVGSHAFGHSHLSCFPNGGETSHFHLDFRIDFPTSWGQIWLPRLRDELRWISRGRQIEITYYGERIEWLYAG
jgi:hypothetical protein